MSLSDMLDAICRDNLDELRTLVALQKCSDNQALPNILLHEAVFDNNDAITEFLLQVGSNPNSGVYSTTPLRIAACNGNSEIIEMLLNHGADINAKDSLGASALMYALIYEEDDATQLLLERGASLFCNFNGRSPLQVAITRGSLKITKMLLQNGAPVNDYCSVKNRYEPFPFHSIRSLSGVDLETEQGYSPLHIASQLGNVRVINLLLNYNADINVRDNNSYTPLYLAIDYKKEDAAVMLIKKGAKVVDEFCNGDTILHLALRRGLSSTVEEILTVCPNPQGEIQKYKKIFESLPQEIINILIKYCFDIEFLHIATRNGYVQIIESILKDRLDLTANFDEVINSCLHIAVDNGEIESVEVLIAHGANVNAKVETRKDYSSQIFVGGTVLHLTAAQEYYPFLRALKIKIAKILLTAGADINAATPTEKLTPLHFACKYSNSNLVKVFLEHNADVNLKDENGKTAIQFCMNNKELTKLLLEHKANVNSQDIDGCTALHSVIPQLMGSDIVELLLKFGADINIKNKNNRTPMDIALLFLNQYCYFVPKFYIMRHAFALDAINLYYAKDLRSSLSKLASTQFDMESHLKNCNQEIENLKSVKVSGYNLTYYALMTRSIHSLASYVKNEDLITHCQSDDFTTEFPIYAPIIHGRLRNAFQRRPFIGEAGEYFNYYFKLPHVCIDHILSYLSADDLKNVKDAMLIADTL